MDALTIHKLSKIYANGFQALHAIDIEVREGDFFALLGPNGAGKTTAIGIITSLVNKTEGTVKVFEHNIDADINAAKACIGFVPQEINLNHFDRALNILVNQAGFYGIPRKQGLKRAEKYLKQLDLWDKKDETVRNLSGGMKRRLMIARALVNEPKLLLLDEPTAGVDVETRRAMWNFLREINQGGTTIILTTHYLEEAEQLCRHLAIIDNGCIVENDSMKNVLRKLKQEVFVLSLDKPIDDMSDMKDYKIKVNDPHEIEVYIKGQQPLNPLFKQLTQAGVAVVSMRNKTNRLEELFFELTQSKQKTNGTTA